jgi:hypothetical protein
MARHLFLLWRSLPLGCSRPRWRKRINFKYGRRRMPESLGIAIIPSRDQIHQFNWFGLGMTIAEDEKYFEPKHGITGNDVAVYEKYFEEAFTAIAR